MSQARPRIDAHQHFWHYEPTAYPWIGRGMEALQKDFLPDRLKGELATLGVDATIAVQARPDEAETAWLLAIAAKEPRVAGVVGWIDLNAPDLASRLQQASRNADLVGFRHMVQDAPDPAALLREEAFNRGVRAIQRQGFVYDVLIHSKTLPEAKQFCARHDQAPLILDHLAKPAIANGEYTWWARHMEAFSRMPHVFCKLSGLVTEAPWSQWRYETLAPYVDKAIEVFGPDRLMFGSDWPVCLLAATYTEVTTVVERSLQRLSISERAAIWGKTAVRCYKPARL